MSRYRNIAFLAELLINILVFSVSCAILAGLFGQAGRLAKGTRSKSQATTEIISLFETLRAESHSILDEVPVTEGGEYAFYYDKNWNPVPAEKAVFVIHLTRREENTGAGTLCLLEASAQDETGGEICSLATEVYHSGRGALSV